MIGLNAVLRAVNITLQLRVAQVAHAVALRRESDTGGLAGLVWSHRPSRTPEPHLAADIPTHSAESATLARDLKRRGFRFVGPTTCFSLMEAIGIIDTHLVGSHRRGSSGVWC